MSSGYQKSKGFKQLKLSFNPVTADVADNPARSEVRLPTVESTTSTFSELDNSMRQVYPKIPGNEKSSTSSLEAPEVIPGDGLLMNNFDKEDVTVFPPLALADLPADSVAYNQEDQTETFCSGNPLDLSETYTQNPKQPRLKRYVKTLFGKRWRSFSSDWFDKYPLLEYSMSRDSVFCFACRHFKPKTQFLETTFTINGLRDWKNLDSKLSKHFSSLAHNDAMAQYVAQASVESGGSVVACLSEGMRKAVERNRSAVRTLMRTAIFCARQGIGLRGHRESVQSNGNEWGFKTTDSNNSECKPNSQFNRGNFVEAVELLKLESDQIRQTLDSLPGNAKYTSKEIQEDFLKVVAGQIREIIRTEISSEFTKLRTTTKNELTNAHQKVPSAQGLIACIVDEARDNSCTEMMSVCVRYVYDGVIHERFMVFIRQEKLDASTLAAELVKFLNTFGLDIEKCIAQSYDGASVMSGHVNGVQKLIRDLSKNPCPYVHCHAHRLNLVLVDLVKNVDGVADSFGLLEAIYAFQSVSTIRHKVFLDVQNEMENVESDRVLAIPQQSDTRWVCKYAGVQYFKKRFACVVQALERLSHSVNKKEAAEARGLLMQFKSVDVIFFLHVFDDLLSVTQLLSLQLQATQLDIGGCRRLLDGVMKTVSEKRTDHGFEKVWDEVVKFANENEVTLPSVGSKRAVRVSSTLKDSIIMSAIGQRQQLTATEHFADSCRQKYFAIIDNAKNEMNRRFTENDDVLNATAALDPSSPFFLSTEMLINLAEKYSVTLQLDLTRLLSQAEVARNAFDGDERPTTCMQLFSELSKMQRAFPDLLALIKVILTFSVASASAERSFSAMRRVKSHLGASMSATQTSNLTLITVERQLSGALLNDPESTIDSFVTMRLRRITLK